MTRHPAPATDEPPGAAGMSVASSSVEPATSLLPSVSIVEQTMAEARRALVLVLGLTALLLVALLVERWHHTQAQAEANQRYAEALRLAGAMRLADLQLTTSAQMAVMSGQAAWVQRFDAHLPEFARLLGEARLLAPAAATARFDAATGAAATELDDMRESAFEAVQVGAVDVARDIFEGERYRQKTALLQQAIADFSEAAVAAAGQRVDDMRRRNALIGLLLLVGAAVLGALLWRRLMGSRGRLLRAEERVKHLAASDLLTGLPNRTALHDAMARELSRAARGGARLAVLMIDLDRFKPVNDRHGHMAGDLVLKEVARRLLGVVRNEDTCARYGGDEFVVLAAEGGSPSSAHHLADRILQAMAQPMHLGPLGIVIGSSVGIARFPDDGRDADELLRKADSALYRAKSQSRGGMCFYDVGLDELITERAALEQAMREGIARGEFVPFAQPIVDLATGQVHSLELLARWHHPQRGLLPPSQFIALAEETGLIGPLTLAVLAAAMAEQADLDPRWRISFNVASQQIQDEALVPQLLALLARHGVAASRMDVELTESALVRDTEAARRVMRALKDAGFTVTLDDFGTGHSNLAYLAEMAFDKIKIDRSFVHAMREPRLESAKIVEAIIGLSRSLGVPNVAEGIETEADAERLTSMGCTLGQGYLYGRPMPLKALAGLRDPPLAPPA